MKIVLHVSQIQHELDFKVYEGWFVYPCKECNYVARENLLTGEISFSNDNPEVGHSTNGIVMTPEFRHAIERDN